MGFRAAFGRPGVLGFGLSGPGSSYLKPVSRDKGTIIIRGIAKTTCDAPISGYWSMLEVSKTWVQIY